MKKTLLLIALILLLASSVMAQERPFTHYSTKTASGLITTGSGYYHGYTVQTDGTNSCTVVVYDNTAASGTAIEPSIVWPTASTMRAGSVGHAPPRAYYNGLYVAITVGGGGSCTVSVDFEPR